MSLSYSWRGEKISATIYPFFYFLNAGRMLELNLQGLNCPLPILRTKKALGSVPTGTILSIFATDPSVPSDFAAFCKQTGHILLSCETRADGVFVLQLQRR